MGDQVHISLSYSPKKETVDKKLKGLPVRWFRVFVENDDEFRLLCKGMQKFKEFSLAIEDDEVTLPSSSLAIEAGSPPKKKRAINILQNVVIPPLPPAKSPTPPPPLPSTQNHDIEFLDDQSQFV